jgi:hypothetical protein
MEPEPVIHREEAVGMLFTITDINVKLARIISLLRGEDDREEEEGPDA